MSGHVVQFTKARIQLLREGPVPASVAHHRLTTCTGITVSGEKVSEPCSAYHGEDKGWGTGHCKACGCPDWPVSQMNGVKITGKAWYPIGCPAGRFSEHHGRKVCPTPMTPTES